LKTLKIASIITFIVIVGFSISLVSALSSSDASIIASLNNPTPKPGNGVTVNVVFNSNVAQELRIYAVGLHADWMNADGFQGPNLSSNPATVESMSSWSVNFMITIPSDASVGSHKYYVGVDGVDASGNPFSLNSAEATLQVIAGSSTGTPTSNPNGGGGQAADSQDWLPYLAVVAAAVIVVVLIVITLMRKKRPVKLASQPVDDQPDSKPAPTTPEEKPASGQDFTI